MRTIMEDVLVVVLVMICLPLAVVILIAIGWTTSMVIPLILPFVLLWLLIKRKRSMPKRTEGRIKLIKLPKVTMGGKQVGILQLIFSIVFTILAVVAFLYVLFLLPPAISALMLFSMIGYSIGRRIKKGGEK